MSFDSDAFAGALWSLSDALDNTAEMTRIPLQALTRALYRDALARRDKWEAGLWKDAYSKKNLGKWIWRNAGKRFDVTNETEILELAREIPARIRRNLIHIAKTIPAPHGGNPRALDMLRGWEARRRVRALREKGLSKKEAYKKVGEQMKVSAHTVRRECEPLERERSRQPKDNGLAFGSLEPRKMGRSTLI
jgi:hypothetical protein